MASPVVDSDAAWHMAEIWRPGPSPSSAKMGEARDPLLTGGGKWLAMLQVERHTRLVLRRFLFTQESKSREGSHLAAAKGDLLCPAGRPSNADVPGAAMRW